MASDLLYSLIQDIHDYIKLYSRSEAIIQAEVNERTGTLQSCNMSVHSTALMSRTSITGELQSARPPKPCLYTPREHDSTMHARVSSIHVNYRAAYQTGVPS